VQESNCDALIKSYLFREKVSIFQAISPCLTCFVVRMAKRMILIKRETCSNSHEDVYVEYKRKYSRFTEYVQEQKM